MNNIFGSTGDPQMPRTARLVVPGAPHHVIQRGNRRQRTFFSPADCHAYLDIAAEAFAEAKVEVWAYCLMPNHVHLIATPSDANGLAAAVGATHLRYTRRINRREGWTGFLWQGRFASSPMDEPHLVHCARYVGLNPVRSGLVTRAEDWRWSSVRAHLRGMSDPLLTRAPLVERLGPALAGFFETDVDDACRRILRAAIDAGSPLGSETWIEALGLNPKRRPVGRPRREIGDTHQFPPSTAAVS